MNLFPILITPILIAYCFAIYFVIKYLISYSRLLQNLKDQENDLWMELGGPEPNLLKIIPSTKDIKAKIVTFFWLIKRSKNDLQGQSKEMAINTKSHLIKSLIGFVIAWCITVAIIVTLLIKSNT
jgi:hypothetical protein